MAKQDTAKSAEENQVTITLPIEIALTLYQGIQMIPVQGNIGAVAHQVGHLALASIKLQQGIAHFDQVAAPKEIE